MGWEWEMERNPNSDLLRRTKVKVQVEAVPKR